MGRLGIKRRERIIRSLETLRLKSKKVGLEPAPQGMGKASEINAFCPFCANEEEKRSKEAGVKSNVHV